MYKNKQKYIFFRLSRQEKNTVYNINFIESLPAYTELTITSLKIGYLLSNIKQKDFCLILNY